MDLESVHEILGWIGSIAFAVCAIPQVYDSWKKGHSRGITWGFYVLWVVGEIFTFLYVIPMGKMPMILNYGLNLIFLGIIGYYKAFPRKRARASKTAQREYLRVVK